MLSYAKNYIDSLGCTHSIDNLVFEFFVKSFSQKTVLDELSEVFSKYIPGWERRKCSKEDCPACSAYSWFKSSIWGGGFYLQYGHYKDFDRVTREWSEYPILRVKFNPNKYWSSPLLQPLLEWFDRNCDDGVLVKFDYAVDVPARTKDIQVHSRKEFGLYKGTRYFGQRGKHGYLKVYDKRLESDLPDDTARVEWTFCCGKAIVFDSVVWLTNGPAPLPDARELGKGYSLARILLDLRACGGDVQQALSYLDYRTAKKLEPYTIGSGVQLFDGSVKILESLLRSYCAELSLSFVSDGVNKISIGRDFVRLSSDDLETEDLPF